MPLPAVPPPAPPPAPAAPERERGRARRVGGLVVRKGARFAGRGARGTYRAGKWALGPSRRRFAVAAEASRPPRERVRAALGGLALLGLTGAVALVLGVLLYALALVPFTPGARTLRAAHEAAPARALSADGVELTRFDRLNRDWVPLARIAPPVVAALVATEDRRFYRHGGVDVYRTLGAAVRTFGGDRQGGSTITQQLARNLFPEAVGREASLGRKLREAVTAVKIERVHGKDDILEIYLNTVPFLYEAYGVEMAARTYFKTSAGELDTLQAATLVGMLKGTSAYNPVRNPERARARRNVVLGLMARDGHLGPARLDVLRAAPLGVRFQRQPVRPSLAPHFTEHVRAWLATWAARNGHSVHADGLVVHTTLDWRVQQVAEAAVVRQGEALQAVADVEWGRASPDRLGTTTAPYVAARARTEPFGRFWAERPDLAAAFVRESAPFARALAAGADSARALDSLRSDAPTMRALRDAKTRLEVGLVALDPRDGQVRAWVGSRDHGRGPYDHVARARRQPGSTFKPFVYARALEEGYTPEDRLRDTDVEIRLTDGSTWRPSNAGTITGEALTLRAALAQSTNTIAVQLVERVGARDVARLARRAGVRQSRLEAVPSIALGTSEVTLLEMTSAFSTLADEGRYRAPVFVTRIEDREGRVLAAFAPAPEQALAPDVSLTLVDMLRGAVDAGTARGVRRDFGLRGDLAGKTGTTQDGADGWFLLMHPHLVTGAWVGFDDPRVTFRSTYWEQGGNNALRVVGDFYQRAQRGGLVSTRARFPPAPPVQRRGLIHRVNALVAWAAELFRGEPAPPPETGPTEAERAARAQAARAREAARRQEAARQEAARQEAAERVREATRRDDRREADRVAREAERAARDVLRDAETAVPDAATLRRVIREAERRASEALAETNPAVREALRAAALAAADEARLLLEDIERGAVRPERGRVPRDREGW